MHGSYQPIFNCSGTARNGGELIKSEFGVGHWFEDVVEGLSLSMHIPSPESMAEVMTDFMQSCDVAHNDD